jgi:hypothetical protein
LSNRYEIYATTTTVEKAKELSDKGVYAQGVNFPDYQLSEAYPKWKLWKVLMF